MWVPRDERFDEERERSGLRFTCEHCAFFHEPTGRCIHGFPNEQHRLSFYDAPGDWIVFCKDFELA
jgi:hypothetical protein